MSSKIKMEISIPMKTYKPENGLNPVDDNDFLMKHLQNYKQKLWNRKLSSVGLAICWHPQRCWQPYGDSTGHREIIPLSTTNF
jgi:hypothetical protein